MRIYLILLLAIGFHAALAQTWQPIGPYGGYFKEFSIDPSDPMTVYAGSDDGGGVWKSTDGGDTWTMLTAAFPNMTGWKIAFNPNSSNTLYACDLYGRYGLLRSTDAGSSWVLLNNGLSSTYDKMVSGLIAYDADTLFISTGESYSGTPPRPGNGMFRSFDGGATWLPTGLQDTATSCLGTNLFKTLFAGTEMNGLFYSNDRGDTWTPHPGIPANSAVHAIEHKGNIVLVGADQGVFLSTDHGITFVNTGLAGDFNFDVAIHKVSPSIELYSSSLSGLQKYSTATSMWTTVIDPELDGQLVIGIASDGIKVYLSTFSNNLLIRSSDAGASWNTIALSPEATEVNDMLIDPTNSDNILTAMMGSYNIGGGLNRNAVRSTNDGGLTWSFKGPEAHGLGIVANPLDPNSQYLGTFSQGLFKSHDSFDTYHQLITGNKLIADIAISTSDTNLVLVSQVDLDLFTTSILRSSDGGAAFTQVSNLPANRLLFDTNSSNSAIAATETGLHLSTDNGVTWSPWVLGTENILSIQSSNGVVYAGTDQGELHLVSGSVATDITGPWLQPTQVKSILVLNNDLYVGLNGAEQDTTMQLSGGLWTSSDNGSSWTDITGSMSNTNVYGKNIIESDGNELYVGTYGGGVFRSDGLALTIGRDQLPALINIFPNPTSGVVTLRIDQADMSPPKLFDIRGQDLSSMLRVTTISNGTLTMDLSDLPTGSYLLHLSGGAVGRIHKL